jgi:hypothetical protein
MLILAAFLVCYSDLTASGDQLLDANTFKSELDTRAKAVTDILVGKAQIIIANNLGAFGPCGSRRPSGVGIGLRGDYYCARVVVARDPHLSTTEYNNESSATSR